MINCTGKIAANQSSSSTNRSNDLLAKFPLTAHRLMSTRAAGWTHKCAVSLSPLSSRCDCCFSLFSGSCWVPTSHSITPVSYSIPEHHPDLVQHRTAQMGSTSTGMVRLGPLIWGLLAFLIGTAIVRRTRTWLRLRHIPGPPFAGISELWLLYKTLGGRCHLDTAEACTKYGA